MSSDKPITGAEMLARIKPRLREESTQICLRPDLLDAWAEAQTELMKSQPKGEGNTQRLADRAAGSRDLAEKVKAIEAEMDATAARFTFRAMTNDKWRALCDKHPPRKGNQMDAMLGYNQVAVEDEAVRLCMIEPEFDDESWAELLDVINPNEWDELRAAVRAANRSVTEGPKSPLASLILDRVENTSRRPAPGE